MTNNNLNVRVYPIDDPKGKTLAFASIAIDEIAAIRGIRVISGAKGMFVTMPQSQDNSGTYHDLAFPLSADLRKEINTSVLNEFGRQVNLDPEQRGYETHETGASNGINAEDVKLDIKVFPVVEPKGNTLAYASVGFEDTVAICGLRVINSDRGQFVSMPQSKDKDGNYHDIAFPLSGDLRRLISRGILEEFSQQAAERKQGIRERIAEGKEQAARNAANAPERMSVAKKAPGLGD